MTTTWLVLLPLLLLLAGAARALFLHRLAARHALLRGGRGGWWTLELRRLACVCQIPGDLQPYPQPREFRIRVWRMGGVPVWWQGCYVSLPVFCDALVGELDGHSFDHLFAPAYRLRSAGGASRSGPRTVAQPG